MSTCLDTLTCCARCRNEVLGISLRKHGIIISVHQLGSSACICHIGCPPRSRLSETPLLRSLMICSQVAFFPFLSADFKSTLFGCRTSIDLSSLRAFGPCSYNPPSLASQLVNSGPWLTTLTCLSNPPTIFPLFTPLPNGHPSGPSFWTKTPSHAPIRGILNRYPTGIWILLVGRYPP
jgi:hypothetical protein